MRLKPEYTIAPSSDLICVIFTVQSTQPGEAITTLLSADNNTDTAVDVNSTALVAVV